LKVVVVDYGVGNIYSVCAALREIGCEFALDTDGSQISESDATIVPGVAAFGAGLKRLESSGQADALRKFFASGKPLIGLCLGAQMFLESSEEDASVSGLGFVKGQVVRLDEPKYRVPNQGWLEVSTSNSAAALQRGILRDPNYFYFSHSYRILVQMSDSAVASASVSGAPILAVYREENVTGVQFHPELSGPTGLAFLSEMLSSLE
jgi:glutamine amidotransferase